MFTSPVCTVPSYQHGMCLCCVEELRGAWPMAGCLQCGRVKVDLTSSSRISSAQLCPECEVSVSRTRGLSHLTSPHPNRLATRQFRQLHLIINRSHQPALYSGISMHPPATCVLVRGSSHITSYVFGVSDTPWWLCHPVIF